MKTVNTIIIALVLMSTSLFAGSPTTMAVIGNATSGVYKVVYKGVETGRVKLAIVNAANELIFSETLTNVSSFIRPYNFNELPEGDYTIVLEDKTGKQVEEVSYKANKIESVISVSKLAGSDSKYMVTVANAGNDIVNVKITDAAGNVLHEKATPVNGNYGLVYNLDQVKSNDSKITFEVSTSGTTHTVSY